MRVKKPLAFGTGNAKLAVHGLLACSGAGRTCQHNGKPVFLQDHFDFMFGDVGSILSDQHITCAGPFPMKWFRIQVEFETAFQFSIITSDNVSIYFVCRISTILSFLYLIMIF